MKLGEFFIELGVKGNTKELKKSLDQMKEAEKQTRRQINLEKELAEAKTEEQKALIRKNYAQKDEIEKTEKAIKVKNEHRQATLGVAKGVMAFVASVFVAVTALDRLINASARANQQMITLSRTSGISLGSFNKYASASASVNYNSSPEQVAQSMQNVASNLWDIRMGRGDISPYQELGFIGGKAINPYGKNVEQIIEEVREAIKGVNDIQATNIITRMGFSPDDLLMLRMSKKEIAEIQDLFMSPKEQEKMNKYALELKKVHMQLDLLKNKIILHVAEMADMWGRIGKKIMDFVKASKIAQTAIKALGLVLIGAVAYFNPLIAVLTSLYLIIEDIAVYFMGGKSVFGAFMNGIKAFAGGIKDAIEDIKMPEWLQNIMGWGSAMFNFGGNNDQYMAPTPQSIFPSQNINQSNSVVVNTTQPADIATGNAINNIFASYIDQYLGSY